jgi:hypothetical protein
MNLVKLPNGNYVNPLHVTLIELEVTRAYTGGPIAQTTTVVHLFGRGYISGITQEKFEGDRRDELAALLNEGAAQEIELTAKKEPEVILPALPEVKLTPRQLCRQLVAEHLRALGVKAKVTHKRGWYWIKGRGSPFNARPGMRYDAAHTTLIDLRQKPTR